MAADTLKVIHTFRHSPLVMAPEDAREEAIVNLEHLNCTRDDIIPSASELWPHVNLVGASLMGVAVFLTLFVSGCFLEISYYIKCHVQHENRRVWMYWIAGLYSMLCWASLCGLFVPRAAVLTDLVLSAYISLCLFFFFRLVTSYYGSGRKRDVHTRLSQSLNTSAISLRSPPLCCCCLCLPTVTITTKLLRILSLMVLQVAFFTPLIAFITGILLLDGSYVDRYDRTNSANLYLSILLAVSTITAMYALTLFQRASQPALAHRALKAKMVGLQLCLVITNVQPIIFSTLATYDVIPCRPPLSSQARGTALHLFTLILEMTLMALISRQFWRTEDAEIKVKDAEKDAVTNGQVNLSLEEDEKRDAVTVEMQSKL